MTKTQIQNRPPYFGLTEKRKAGRRKFIEKQYDMFEKKGLSVQEALAVAENKIHASVERTGKCNALRNDMSSHMGNITDVFDRKKHTHGMAELQ